jgi:molybdenum cofactor synthesis domain-containing protein
VTTGGTGLSPRDQTPEGTARVLERLVPGIAEELRRLGAAAKPAGMLSRGLAGVVGDALVVNLPGSPAAVADGCP